MLLTGVVPSVNNPASDYSNTIVSVWVRQPLVVPPVAHHSRPNNPGFQYMQGKTDGVIGVLLVWGGKNQKADTKI